MNRTYNERSKKSQFLQYLAIALIIGLIVLWGSGCNTVKRVNSSEEKTKDSTTSELQEWWKGLSSDSVVTQNDNGTYFKAYIWKGGDSLPPRDSFAFLRVESEPPSQQTVVPPGYSYFEKVNYNRDKKTSVRKTQDEHYTVYHHFNVTTRYVITETTKNNSRTSWWLPILFISIVCLVGMYLFNKFSNPILSFFNSLK